MSGMPRIPQIIVCADMAQRYAVTLTETWPTWLIETTPTRYYAHNACVGNNETVLEASSFPDKGWRWTALNETRYVKRNAKVFSSFYVLWLPGYALISFIFLNFFLTPLETALNDFYLLLLPQNALFLQHSVPCVWLLQTAERTQ